VIPRRLGADATGFLTVPIIGAPSKAERVNPLITSLKNPRVQEAVRLRAGRQRRKRGCCLIEGTRELQRAARAGVRWREVFACQPLCDHPAARELIDQLLAGRVPLHWVTPEVYEKLAYGQRSEGILAVAQTPHRTLAELPLSSCPLVAVLEGVAKPGNVGAVIRTADAAAVDAVILADAATDLYNPNAIRASLGTIFTLPVSTASAIETRAWLQQHGLQVLAARVDAQPAYTQVDFTRPTAIVLGSESSGLSAVWQAGQVTPVRLPMRGVADSLNVSAAAAVLLFEAARQRDAAAERADGSGAP